MMLKKFSTAPPEVYTKGNKNTPSSSFIVDDSWLASVKEILSVIDSDKKKWKTPKWVGPELTPASTPGTTAVFVVFLKAGRGRRNRYVASDGEVWADVHGRLTSRSYRRSWTYQKGPWNLVDVPGARPLTMNAQRVIKAAINAFMQKEANPR